MNIKIPNFNPYKQTYRVFEIKKGNGTSKFYPQTRHAFFIWKPIMESLNSSNPEWFPHLADANKFLYDRTRKVRAKTTVGTEAHEFNEVFHKLSSNDTNRRTSNDDDCDSCSG